MKWRRLYSGGPFHLLVGCLIAFGVAFFTWTMLFLDRERGALGPKGGMAIAIVAFVIVWESFLVWLFRLGIFVGEEGIRVRRFARTVTLGWPEVRDIRLAPLKPPSWMFWIPIPLENQTIWIDRFDGPPIQTDVNNQSAEFLGRRRAFEQAVRVLRQELEKRRGNMGEE
jgi:hypothetical protein